MQKSEDAAELTTRKDNSVSPRPSVDRRQGLLVFFAAELVNATDYKPRNPTTWPMDFKRFFFDEFGKRFVEAANEFYQEFGKSAAPKRLAPPRLWKVMGDQLVYVDSVYPNETPEYPILAASVQAFVQSIERLDHDLLKRGLGVRGCAWTAGFPIRNKEIVFRAADPIPMIRSKDTLDFEMGDLSLPFASATYDYIGPDMDLGFHLASSCLPGRVICNLDIAYLISKNPSHRVRMFQLGWQVLKGLIGDNPYPVLYLSDQESLPTRTPWERAESESSDGSQKHRLSSTKAVELAESVWNTLPTFLRRPYANWTDVEGSEHPDTWRNSADRRLVSPYPIGDGDESGDVVGENAAVIQEDLLNQIQIKLAGSEGETNDLLVVLRTIAGSEAYKKWDGEAQYSGAPFCVPPTLKLGPPELNRLAEWLGLVNRPGHQLMTKITTHGDLVFLTDGLWVPGEIRVFPFADESDILASTIARLGWGGWANLVIDPCCGCGHNMLKYPGGPETERYAFDVSTRALNYTSINCTLNRVKATHIGLNDIRRGIPERLHAQSGDKVLFIVNAPFALEPVKGTLPLSAQGGRYGWEMTVAALDAIRTFETRSDGAAVRSVVLSYSLGRLHKSEWVVPNKARALFGEGRTSWQILDDEKLWRINGRKEQDNPMPIDRLSLKAEDRFYIRNDDRRDDTRKGYRNLESALAAEGYTHLAYGVLSIADQAMAGKSLAERT